MIPSYRSMDILCLIFAALTLTIQSARPEPSSPIAADIVLVGGTILDGSGHPGTTGNVAIRGDRIVAVGRFNAGRAGRTISCVGLMITPGFIDLHNHSDSSITIEDPRTGKSKKSRPILAEKTRSAACYLTQNGFYASHIRDEGDQLIESIEEAIEVGRLGNLPVHISHLKASKRHNWGKVRAAAAHIEKVRLEGRRVTADQSPFEYTTGMQWVFVNGQAAIDDGKLSVTDAGQPLRKTCTIVGD